MGRAARNQNGSVVMYADRMSDAMKQAIDETQRRRAIQEKYNEDHGITPTTIIKAIDDILVRQNIEKQEVVATELSVIKNSFNILVPSQRKLLIKALEKQMIEHADMLQFEQAAAIRDEIEALKKEYGNQH